MKFLRIHNTLLSLVPVKLYQPIFNSLMRYRARGFKKSGYTVIFGKKKTVIEKIDKQIILNNKHLVYLTDVRNMFNYYFDSLVSDKKNKHLVLDFSSPRTHTFKSTGLSFDFTSVPEDDWEIDEYLKEYSIKKGDIILDAGSYCGYSAYNFSKKVGEKGKVYCLEPDEENYKFLIKNIKRHNLKNVIPIKKGLWSETTELYFYKEGALGSSITKMGYRPSHSTKTKIKTLSLEDFFNKFHLKELNFVKMDIEGAETEAIADALDFIMNRNINFAISCHPRNEKGRSINTSEILSNLFKIAGYRSRIKIFKYRTYEAYLIYANNRKNIL